MPVSTRPEWYESLASFGIALVWATAVTLVASKFARVLPAIVVRRRRNGEKRQKRASIPTASNLAARVSAAELIDLNTAVTTLNKALPRATSLERMQAAQPTASGVNQSDFNAARRKIEALSDRVYASIFASQYRLLRSCVARPGAVTLATAYTYYEDGVARGGELAVLDWLGFLDERFNLIKRTRADTELSQRIDATDMGGLFLAWCDLKNLDDTTLSAVGRHA